MMMNAVNKHQALAAVCRTDLQAFYHKLFSETHAVTCRLNWHHELLIDKLVQCVTGKIKRLIVCLPPRSGKSTLISEAFPAWIMGHDPKVKVITASYSSRLSAEFSRKQLQVMNTSWYKEIFPGAVLNPKKQSEDHFCTLAGGHRLATSPGSTLTGMGGDIIILDDLISPADAMSDVERKKTNDWVQHTLLSRLDDKEHGVIIAVMQRTHHDDVIAHLLEMGGWDMVSLPAIAEEDEYHALSTGKVLIRRKGEALHPERESLAQLQKIEMAMTPYYFATQYQQRPSNIKGNIIKLEWFKSFEGQPEFPQESRHQVQCFQSWDTAMKIGDDNDYSVCTTWLSDGRSHHYLTDVYRGRLDAPSLRQKALDLRKEYKADLVLVEDTGSGTGLLQELDRAFIPHKAIKPEKDKVSRLSNCSTVVYDGHVFLPQDAPWLETFLDEMRLFPYARHDDQVDSFSQMLNYLQTREIGSLDIV